MFKVWVLKKYNFEKDKEKQCVITARLCTDTWSLPLGVTAGDNYSTWSYDITLYFLCFAVKFQFFGAR